MPSHSALPVILVAEDDPDDLILLKSALADANVQNPVHTFGNGSDLIDFLLRFSGATETAAPTSRPRLLLLDLHLPQIDGCGVIAWVRKQTALRGLRIVVISGSGDSTDVKRAVALGADKVFVKPISDEALRAEIAWLNNSSDRLHANATG